MPWYSLCKNCCSFSKKKSIKLQEVPAAAPSIKYYPPGMSVIDLELMFKEAPDYSLAKGLQLKAIGPVYFLESEKLFQKGDDNPLSFEYDDIKDTNFRIVDILEYYDAIAPPINPDEVMEEDANTKPEEQQAAANAQGGAAKEAKKKEKKPKVKKKKEGGTTQSVSEKQKTTLHDSQKVLPKKTSIERTQEEPNGKSAKQRLDSKEVSQTQKSISLAQR